MYQVGSAGRVITAELAARVSGPQCLRTSGWAPAVIQMFHFRMIVTVSKTSAIIRKWYAVSNIDWLCSAMHGSSRLRQGAQEQ